MSVLFASTHFPWAELACRDGSDVPDALRPNARRLCLHVLEPLRAKFGGPLVVVSGYRSPAYNARVGGASKSRHMVGDAVDIRPVSFSDLPRLKSTIEAMIDAGEIPALGGYGTYRHWVHVDTRPRAPGSPIARWGADKEGGEQ